MWIVEPRFSQFAEVENITLVIFFYIKVPGADTAAIAAISVAALTNGGRLCGRAFSSVTALLTTTTAGTVCGKSVMCGSSNPVF